MADRDLDQHVAFFDQLIVIHMHHVHAAGDFWRDGNEVHINERVIG